MSLDISAEEICRTAKGLDTPVLFVPRYKADIEPRSTKQSTGQKVVDIWEMDKHTRENYITEHLDFYF
ncbi:hypothetical protein HYV64_00565 [Candidatus Shapirobacteria bacterium]|nr:hypothetical protein [Candidatus Shapirobacteria bacterium]